VQDPRWSKQIQSEIQRTEVALRLSRGVAADARRDREFKVGQILELKATARSLVKIESRTSRCSGVILDNRRNVHAARSRNDRPQSDFIDDILLVESVLFVALLVTSVSVLQMYREIKAARKIRPPSLAR